MWMCRKGTEEESKLRVEHSIQKKDAITCTIMNLDWSCFHTCQLSSFNLLREDKRRKKRHWFWFWRRGVLSSFGPLVCRNCPVCFGWCARFVPNFRLRQQAYSAYLDPWHTGVCFVCFGWSARCALRLQSEDCFVSQSGWWHRQRKWRQGQVKLAEREVWCGRLARLEDE
jgi:hypothetical protein